MPTKSKLKNKQRSQRISLRNISIRLEQLARIRSENKTKKTKVGRSQLQLYKRIILCIILSIFMTYLYWQPNGETNLNESVELIDKEDVFQFTMRKIVFKKKLSKKISWQVSEYINQYIPFFDDVKNIDIEVTGHYSLGCKLNSITRLEDGNFHFQFGQQRILSELYTTKVLKVSNGYINQWNVLQSQKYRQEAIRKVQKQFRAKAVSQYPKKQIIEAAKKNYQYQIEMDWGKKEKEEGIFIIKPILKRADNFLLQIKDFFGPKLSQLYKSFQQKIKEKDTTRKKIIRKPKY